MSSGSEVLNNMVFTTNLTAWKWTLDRIIPVNSVLSYFNIKIGVFRNGNETRVCLSFLGSDNISCVIARRSGRTMQWIEPEDTAYLKFYLALRLVMNSIGMYLHVTPPDGDEPGCLYYTNGDTMFLVAITGDSKKDVTWVTKLKFNRQLESPK